MVLVSTFEVDFKREHAHTARATQDSHLRSLYINIGRARCREDGAVVEARDANRGRAVERATGVESQDGRDTRFGDAFLRMVATLGGYFDYLFPVYNAYVMSRSLGRATPRPSPRRIDPREENRRADERPGSDYGNSI